jgi:hypothetical protein
MGFVSCWVSASIYLNSENIQDEDKLDAATLYGVLGLLTTLAVASFSLFLLTIKREYIHTFFSTQSGTDQARNNFLNCKTDAQKCRIFLINTRYWKAVYPQLSEWVFINFERWQVEKEEWFTEDLIARIPDEMIPARNLELLGGVLRRRSSLKEQLGLNLK